jgi:hypothetical protein
MAAHIPTSLLEVNTIGHILCAFIIYLLWWSKPREIHVPTVLKGDWVDSMCAYMYMSSRVSGTRIKGRFKPRSWVTPELKRCVYLDYDQALISPRSLCSSRNEIVDAVDTQTRSDSQKAPPTRVTSVDSHLSGAFELQPVRHLDSQKTISRKLKMGWTPEPNSDSTTLRRTRHMLAELWSRRIPQSKPASKN